MANTTSPPGGAAWRSPLLHALPVAALILGLYYYWFAVADRYIVFLYYHDMGPRVPDTTPFSAETSSRYWMAGLVAAGAVMVGYTAASWLLGRLAATYRPPDWRQVWAGCAPALLVGIPAITMTVNQPTLPAWNAAQTTLAALVGLALALMPGRTAAERPGALAWLALDGLGLGMVLGQGFVFYPFVLLLLEREAAIRVMPLVGLLAGAGWLLALAPLRRWRRAPVPRARETIAAVLCLSYPLMALTHHVLGTDGYFYISSSSNFFIAAPPLQVGLWAMAAALAVALAWLRGRSGGKAQGSRRKTQSASPFHSNSNSDL